MNGGVPGAASGGHRGCLDRQTHQGKFAEHYVQAVVASAGFQCTKPEDYGDGVDITIARTHERVRQVIIPPNVDLQVKSTRILRDSLHDIVFDLEVHHYNLLCAKSSNPRYLVVVDVRGDRVGDWIGYGDQFTVLHRAAYWKSLAGQDGSDNDSSVRVKIPRANRFTHRTVHEMMDEAKAEYLSRIGRMSHEH